MRRKQDPKKREWRSVILRVNHLNPLSICLEKPKQHENPVVIPTRFYFNLITFITIINLTTCVEKGSPEAWMEECYFES